MPLINFIPKPLIFIDFNQYIEEQQLDENVDNEVVSNIISDITRLIFNEQNPLNLAINDNEINPISSTDSINDYISDIKTVVRFLDDNQIPWTGGIVAMTRDDTAGFLAIKNVNQGYASPVVIVGYVSDNLELDKQYYPLSDVAKQI